MVFSSVHSSWNAFHRSLVIGVNESREDAPGDDFGAPDESPNGQAMWKPGWSPMTPKKIRAGFPVMITTGYTLKDPIIEMITTGHTL